MGEEYDPNKPTKSLLYLDANSLYPTAMIEALPVDQFEWNENPNEIDIKQVADDAEYGYILEVDLHVPSDKHDFFNDYPLAPEKMQVTRDMLSPFQREHFPSGKGTEKLVPHLSDKENYVAHYRTLKLYISLGIKVIKVHRAIRFRQLPWLKPFMELCVDQRREAAQIGDKARVGVTKLAMNAVYGKACENVRKHVNIELVTSNKIASPIHNSVR